MSPDPFVAGVNTLDRTVMDEWITSRMLIPTVIKEICTANTDITSSSDTDITGATTTFRVPRAMTAIVTIDVCFSGDTLADLAVFEIDTDGTDQSLIVHSIAVADHIFQASCTTLVPLTAGSHTIKLQGLRFSGTGTISVYTPQTRLTLMLIGDANVTNS